MANRLLSKSKYLNGLQCPRLLWVACNEPERIPTPDAALQRIFDQGHLVGELAKRLFPGGIDIPHEDSKANLTATKDLMRERKPLFEAGVMAGSVYSRADIMRPVETGEWDIIEVKGATSVKDVNLHDVSFQRLCWEDSGVKIRKCFLAHVNNEYVKQGEIDPLGLFAIEDVTDTAAETGEGLRDRVATMLIIIRSKACPEKQIGPHCDDPYPCPLADECWKGLPEHNIFTLYYGGKKAYELYCSGVEDIAAIPDGFKLNDKQHIQRDCVLSGEPHLEKAPIRKFLAGLEYPLYFLDFETFATSIPLFDGTRPFQKIPFQFSLHVCDKPGTKPKHFSFLAEGRQDPRPGLLWSLGKLIGDKGSVIAYNMSFEKGVLEELGEVFPEYAGWAEGVVSRLVDLIVPFRSFHYYHPAQKGSASLKSVLPAVTGIGYKDLPIAKGDDASVAFLTITFEDVPAEETARVRKELLAYCKLDTEGMVRIVEMLGTI